MYKNGKNLPLRRSFSPKLSLIGISIFPHYSIKYYCVATNNGQFFPKRGDGIGTEIKA